MDEQGLMKYLGVHGFARIGKDDTQKAADKLDARGLIKKVGNDPASNLPVYGLTKEGLATFRNGESLLKKALNIAQDYAASMREGDQGSGGLSLGDASEFDVTKEKK